MFWLAFIVLTFSGLSLLAILCNPCLWHHKYWKSPFYLTMCSARTFIVVKLLLQQFIYSHQKSICNFLFSQTLFKIMLYLTFLPPALLWLLSFASLVYYYYLILYKWKTFTKVLILINLSVFHCPPRQPQFSACFKDN